MMIFGVSLIGWLIGIPVGIALVGSVAVYLSTHGLTLRGRLIVRLIYLVLCSVPVLLIAYHVGRACDDYVLFTEKNQDDIQRDFDTFGKGNS